MEKAFMENTLNWSLRSDDDNVYWLEFNRADSRVNSLNEACMRELDQILTTLSHDTTVRALIIRSGKSTGFIVGADVSQFKALASAIEATQLIRQGQEIFNKLENLTIPTVALIEGMCLGGGLELALACRYRIAEDSAKTRLGLPEVKLGIHPGWGGTVRLPEKIGVLGAMDVILSGRMLQSKAAKKMGVVHEAIPQRLIEKVAKYYALQAPVPKKGMAFQTMLEWPFVRPWIGKYLHKQLSKKISAKHYPAPFEVVDNWVKYGIKRPKAMDVEAESIGQLLVSDTSKNLVRVFFLQDELKNLGKKSEFKPKHVHVIGAGVMGGDIAAWCALRGCQVTLQDQAPKLIGHAIKRTYDLAKKQLKEHYLVQGVMDKILPDPEGRGIARADVIIEAITEKLSAKQDLFSRLEKQAKSEAILATNTSTIPLEEIGQALSDPSRLVGIHFFNPVAKMPLVEVVRGKETSATVMDKAMAFVRAIDKLPLPVKSSPGFLVNRILLPYMLEAMALLQEGVSGSVIDKAAVNFGMPMGPIELADTVGLDICLAALEKLAPILGGSIPKELKDYVAKGELGRKTGKGFYEYKHDHAVKPTVLNHEKIPADIAQRLVLRILNESVACLREGIVENADQLDAGCIFGFGFAPFRGGPLAYARHEGSEKIITLFNEFESRYGSRFTADQGWSSVMA